MEYAKHVRVHKTQYRKPFHPRFTNDPLLPFYWKLKTHLMSFKTA